MDVYRDVLSDISAYIRDAAADVTPTIKANVYMQRGTSDKTSTQTSPCSGGHNIERHRKHCANATIDVGETCNLTDALVNFETEFPHHISKCPRHSKPII